MFVDRLQGLAAFRNYRERHWASDCEKIKVCCAIDIYILPYWPLYMKETMGLRPPTRGLGLPSILGHPITSPREEFRFWVKAK
eukprot:scaffold656_cov403-Pavlova_lutheri.AAC.8